MCLKIPKSDRVPSDRRRISRVQEFNRHRSVMRAARINRRRRRAEKSISIEWGAARAVNEQDAERRAAVESCQFGAEPKVTWEPQSSRDRMAAICAKKAQSELRAAARASGNLSSLGKRSSADRRPLDTPKVILSHKEFCGEDSKSSDRRRHRAHALILSEEERRRCHWMVESAERCGRMAVVMHRPGSVRGTREIAAMRIGCRSRMCAPCFKRIRRGHESRIKGPWAQLVTMGLPSGQIGIRQAWESIHVYIRRYTHALRDALRNNSDALAVKGGGKLEYAWVIEAHKSGWPHVHMVHNLRWLDREWSRSAWARATRCEILAVHGAVVRDESDCSRYLVKYLAKANLSVDVLSILKNKHLMGSTLRKKPKEDEGWRVVHIDEYERVADVISGSSPVLRGLGAGVIRRVEGWLAVWLVEDGPIELYRREYPSLWCSNGPDWMPSRVVVDQLSDWDV